MGLDLFLKEGGSGNMKKVTKINHLTHLKMSCIKLPCNVCIMKKIVDMCFWPWANDCNLVFVGLCSALDGILVISYFQLLLMPSVPAWALVAWIR